MVSNNHQVVVDLGLVETCCTDSPCGPAGAFAEYAVALADTVAKRQGLASKEVVGLPLAGQEKIGSYKLRGDLSFERMGILFGAIEN